ncbi:MAG: fructose bisphosphate aldolase [Actinomycetes bacterium]
MNLEQLAKMRNGNGFIAALDQSGGSTPKALKLYGIAESQYVDEAAMFDLVHQMRARIITSPVFNGDRILGVILFEMTMDRKIDGLGSAEYLWQRKQIVPFLKVDVGLQYEIDGVQLMKPIADLSEKLESAGRHGVFGTKMRSIIAHADPIGVSKVVNQQFAFGKRIMETGLVPIIEPEVDINSTTKLESEILLKKELIQNLNSLTGSQHVLLKLTLPDEPNFYSELVNHPRVIRVVALSGGYSRSDANELLAKNQGVVASFSRALSEGLTAQQSAAEFDQMLDDSIESIYQASIK